MNTGTPPVCLASTSPYRRELLSRLNIAFTTLTPKVDETCLAGEDAGSLVRRLAEAKARAVSGAHRGLIIGSDQVATLAGDILGKPGDHEQARDQLQQLSGRTVTFLTGLCLLNSLSGQLQLDVVPFRVHFRTLSMAQIERYLEHDRPYDCAGSFKSEGLGITLFERMEGDDPTALIGLPLIRLTGMFELAGVTLP